MTKSRVCRIRDGGAPCNFIAGGGRPGLAGIAGVVIRNLGRDYVRGAAGSGEGICALCRGSYRSVDDEGFCGAEAGAGI